MPFQPGQSGNPAGRKAGQANRLTAAVRNQIAAGADPIFFLQKVMAGEPIAHADGEHVIPTLDQQLRAATTLASKIAPDAKDYPVQLSIGAVNGPTAALAAMGAVADRMAAGELTPVEASAVMGVIGHYTKAYELTELERRVADLEGGRVGKAVA